MSSSSTNSSSSSDNNGSTSTLSFPSSVASPIYNTAGAISLLICLINCYFALKMLIANSRNRAALNFNIYLLLCAALFVWTFGVIMNITYNNYVVPCYLLNTSATLPAGCPQDPFLASGFLSEFGVVVGSLLYVVMLLTR